MSRALDGLGAAMAHTKELDATAVERLEYLIRASVRVLVERKQFVTLLLLPVSYTHLDVYKRQEALDVVLGPRRAGLRCGLQLQDPIQRLSLIHI